MAFEKNRSQLEYDTSGSTVITLNLYTTEIYFPIYYYQSQANHVQTIAKNARCKDIPIRPFLALCTAHAVEYTVEIGWRNPTQVLSYQLLPIDSHQHKKLSVNKECRRSRCWLTHRIFRSTFQVRDQSCANAKTRAMVQRVVTRKKSVIVLSQSTSNWRDRLPHSLLRYVMSVVSAVISQERIKLEESGALFGDRDAFCNRPNAFRFKKGGSESLWRHNRDRSLITTWKCENHVSNSMHRPPSDQYDIVVVWWRDGLRALAFCTKMDLTLFQSLIVISFARHDVGPKFGFNKDWSQLAKSPTMTTSWNRN